LVGKFHTSAGMFLWTPTSISIAAIIDNYTCKVISIGIGQLNSGFELRKGHYSERSLILPSLRF